MGMATVALGQMIGPQGKAVPNVWERTSIQHGRRDSGNYGDRIDQRLSPSSEISPRAT